ncbi:MAG: tetratricopeptide repeat protein [Alphaproteobacteria bacterium]|nr:tetratricopeptide repeat protein [Alphaproteobacteria bacterium]
MNKYLNFAYSNTKEVQIKNLEQLYKHEKYEELISFSKAFIKKFPENALIYNILGISYFKLKKFDEAINYYNKSININVNNADAYNNKGLALKALGNSKDAILDFQKALELNNDFVDAYNNLGNILWDLELYQNSEDVW